MSKRCFRSHFGLEVCTKPTINQITHTPAQCNTNMFRFSDIRIFEYWAPNIRYSNMNTQLSCCEYNRYSYSANLLKMNIFDIHIQSCYKQWLYSIFVFGPQSEYEYIWYSYSVESFINMFLSIDRQQKSLGTCLNMQQNSFIIYFMAEGGLKSLHFIYSILVFGQVSKNEYIRYSHLVRYLKTNIFDIRIRSGCQTEIYSIFIFG